MTDKKLLEKTAGLLITDFDGTIKPSNGCVSDIDKKALKKLGDLGWLRVIATGRSLFAFARDWKPDLELDILVFSSGLGLCCWDNFGSGSIIKKYTMPPHLTKKALEIAKHLNFGYFLYFAPPDSHHYFFQTPLKERPLKSFTKRLEMYYQQARQIEKYYNHLPWASMGMLLIMLPYSELKNAYNLYQSSCPELSLLHSTSPFEQDIAWLEIYPPGVSKGQTLLRLIEKFKPSKTIALGNDFNDLDMLDKTHYSFVSEDSPQLLKDMYHTMPAAGLGGLKWVLDKLKI